MKIETQPQDNCTLTITVEVEDERVQPALRSAARRLSKQYRFPGFRPGKAPYETVVRQVGENAIYGEAIEELGQAIYQEALDQENVTAYAPGELDDVQFKPMVLKFTVPLPPEVELGDYRADLRVPFTASDVSDADVQANLDTLREEQAVLEPVDEPAKIGDQVALDVKAFLNEGENPSDFLMADENASLVLAEGGDWPLPGFEQHVVGMKAGEEKKFDMPFADDYPNESLRGQVSHFEVKVNEVKQRTLPEWDDELAKTLGEYESLEDMRAKVRAEMESQAEFAVRRQYADQVVEQLVEGATVKFPPVMLEHELDHFVQNLDQRLRGQRLTLDDYLKMQAKTMEELRADATPQAEARLKRSLVLGEVVTRERVRVPAEAIESHIQSLSESYGDSAQAMREVLASNEARQMIAMDLLTDAAVDRLVAIARGEDVPELEADDDGDDADAQPEYESAAIAAAAAAQAADDAEDAAEGADDTPDASETVAEAAPEAAADDAETDPAQASE